VGAVNSLVMLGKHRLFKNKLALVSLLGQLPFSRPFSLAFLTSMMSWLAMLVFESNLSFRPIHLCQLVVQVKYGMQTIVHQLPVLFHYKPF
jgi:hypothetical protein